MPALLHQVLAFATLRDAWHRVRGNRGCAGGDGETLEQFETDLETKLAALRNEVLKSTYAPRPLLSVVVESPGKKPRRLAVPAVRDRVLQTAVAIVLTPLCEAEFEDCSFGYRRGRSVDQAVRRIMQYRDRGFRWVVDADIAFAEIDHERLVREVAELVQDVRLIDLIKIWLSAPITDLETTWRPTKGIALGSPISPLLANLYLDHLDEALLGEDLRLVRFSDDFLILCKHEEHAALALDLTEEVLGALRLRLNRAKTRIVDFERGFRFLGVEFVRDLVLKCRTSDAPPAFAEMLPPEEPGTEEPLPLYVEAEAALTEAEPAIQGALALALTEVLKLKQEDTVLIADAEDRLAVDEKEPAADHDPRLRTLYLMEHGCVLGKESERLVVRKNGAVLQEIPAIKVDQILVFGNSQITTQAMAFCLIERIPIVLLSGRGRYYGVIDSLDTDPVLLQRDQFLRSAEPEFCLGLARAIVTGKLQNMRLILRRYARKREAPALPAAERSLQGLVADIAKAQTLDALRGYEGSGSKAYFEGLRTLLPAAWGFKKRVRQPPTDPFNALLSYGYTLLFYNIYALVRARGLSPHAGFLHPLRAGHPALVSDLIEEFRAPVVDALVLSLVLNGRLAAEDFRYAETPDRACMLSDEARKTFIHAFEAKMNAAVTHPATGRRLDYRRCIDEQVKILASVIRGKQVSYTPMVLR
ncbi:MAG: CRISPR-associated endonuclease Cas1 [Gammaproteobacteria bacterium]